MTARVGLLVGTEAGFPGMVEDLLARADADPALPGLAVTRVRLGPFDPAADPGFDLVIDRVSHGHPYAAEWLKAAALRGAYCLTNPFRAASLSKAAGHAALAALGVPGPPTRVLPPKSAAGLRPGVAAATQSHFSLAEVGERLGYPLYLKPTDGGGGIGVTRPGDPAALSGDYDESGPRVMLAQAAAEGGRFVRCLAAGWRVAACPYDPGAPLHRRYPDPDAPVLAPGEAARLAVFTRRLTAFHGFELASVEFREGPRGWEAIDFTNPTPDACPTRLHRHGVWLAAALVEWVCFVVASGRRPRLETRMGAWTRLAATPEGPARDRARARLAAEYFQAADFEAFAAGPGARVWEHVRGYLASGDFAARVLAAAGAQYPAHESAGAAADSLARCRRPVRPNHPCYGSPTGPPGRAPTRSPP